MSFGTINQYLMTRKERGKNQKLYLIESIESTLQFKKEYMVMGSTGNVYKVTISSMPTCTCPDNQLRHRRCKHIYFILIRIMNVSKNEDKNKFSKRDLMKMFKSIPEVTRCLIINDKLKEIYNKKINKNENVFVGKKSVDDLCPICLDDLMNGDELDYCKYSCGKAIHKECFQMWAKVKANKCLFCHEPLNVQENNRKYINLIC